MTTETIEWIACADDLPDDDETVLIYVPGDDAEPVMVGYLDGDEWRDGTAYPVLSEVVAWARMPGGPKA